jgi:hypothetical protein
MTLPTEPPQPESFPPSTLARVDEVNEATEATLVDSPLDDEALARAQERLEHFEEQLQTKLQPPPTESTFSKEAIELVQTALQDGSIEEDLDATINAHIAEWEAARKSGTEFTGLHTSPRLMLRQMAVEFLACGISGFDKYPPEVKKAILAEVDVVLREEADKPKSSFLSPV